MSNILNFFKMISEYKKEIRQLDPDCKVVFNLSKEYSGNYNRSTNTISISLTGLGKNIFNLDFSDKKLSQLAHTFFHERRHLIDFKFKGKPQVSGHLVLELLAFENKYSLYQNKCYGEIWYEQRAICDGFVSGTNFMERLFPDMDHERILSELVDKKSKEKHLASREYKYTFLRDLLSNNQKLTHSQLKTELNKVLNTIPTRPFSPLYTKLANQKYNLYSILDFANSKHNSMSEKETAVYNANLFTAIHLDIISSSFHDEFSHQSRLEQLVKLIAMDDKYFELLSPTIPDFSNIREELENLIDKDLAKKVFEHNTPSQSKDPQPSSGLR